MLTQKSPSNHPYFTYFSYFLYQSTMINSISILLLLLLLFHFIIQVLCQTTEYEYESMRPPEPNPTNQLWNNIFTVGCDGGVHLFTGTILQVDLNLNSFMDLSNVYADEISERAKCACPSITDDEIERRFLPSIPAVLSQFVWQDQQIVSLIPNATQTNCSNTIFPRTWFDNSFFTSVFQFDMNGIILPNSCQYQRFMNGKPCSFQVVPKTIYPNLPIEMNLNVIIDRCPQQSIWPFIKITCDGYGCATFGMPCVTDDDCYTTDEGDDAVCQLWGLDTTSTTFQSFAQTIGLIGDVNYTESLTCAANDTLLWSLTNDIRTEFFQATSPLETTDDPFALGTCFSQIGTIITECYASPSYNSLVTSAPSIAFRRRELMNDDDDDFENDLKEGKQEQVGQQQQSKQPQQSQDQDEIVTSHSRRLQTDNNPIDIIGCVIQNIFAVANADMPEETYPIPSQYNITLDSCASISGCHFSTIGDGYCNPQCNIPQCFYDGGDCENCPCLNGINFSNCTSGDPNNNNGIDNTFYNNYYYPKGEPAYACNQKLVTQVTSTSLSGVIGYEMKYATTELGCTYTSSSQDVWVCTSGFVSNFTTDIVGSSSFTSCGSRALSRICFCSSIIYTPDTPCLLNYTFARYNDTRGTCSALTLPYDVCPGDNRYQALNYYSNPSLFNAYYLNEASITGSMRYGRDIINTAPTPVINPEPDNLIYFTCDGTLSINFLTESQFGIALSMPSINPLLTTIGEYLSAVYTCRAIPSEDTEEKFAIRYKPYQIPFWYYQLNPLSYSLPSIWTKSGAFTDQTFFSFVNPITSDPIEFYDNTLIGTPQITSTLLLSYYFTNNVIRGEFSRLTQLFGYDTNVGIEFDKCSTFDGFPSFSISLNSLFQSSIQSVQECLSDSNCGIGNICMDLKTELPLFSNASRATSYYNQSIEIDPFSSLIWGWTRLRPSQCDLFNC
jgi:hypothetical protein